MRSLRVFRRIWKCPVRVCPQMSVKPRKVKVSGLPSPRCSRLPPHGGQTRSTGSCPDAATAKTPATACAVLPETAWPQLRAQSPAPVIRVADDDHVAGGVAFAPLLRPEIENVVQVGVSQQGGNRRPLWRTPRLSVTIPSSSTPAFSHLRISRRTRSSPIRCSRKRMSHSWLTVPKKSRTSTSTIQFTFFR